MCHDCCHDYCNNLGCQDQFLVYSVRLVRLLAQLSHIVRLWQQL